MKNFWRDRNVFVTGATGLLGSWLVKYLVGRGARVVALVRDDIPDSNLLRQDVVDKITAVRGELEDYFLLQRVVAEYEIETVFHLAAQTIVSVANRSPLSTFQSNIQGTWNLLEAVRQAGTVRQVVVSSSDKAYGEKEHLPYKETDQLRGVHPYDVSKSCADLISQSYAKTYRTPVCVTRCANLYGGGDLNFSRIIPGTIRSALYGESPIIRSDGKYIRDYFYVEDAAAAFLLLAEKMENPRIHGEAFNFSSGIHVDVVAVAKKILTLMGRTRLKLKILDEVKNEIKDQYLSIAKARSVLGWRPAYTLEDGLKRTIRWYEEHMFDGASRQQ